jgi:hypothetical protein
VLDCARAGCASYGAVRSHADLTQRLQTACVITLRQLVAAGRLGTNGRLGII